MQAFLKKFVKESLEEAPGRILKLSSEGVPV